MTMTNVLIVVCFVLAAYFPLMYSRSHWRKYLPGQAVMYFSIIVTVVFGLGVWRVFAGQFPPEWIRSISYLLVASALAFMDAALTREQRRDRRKAAAEIERLEGIENLRRKS